MNFFTWISRIMSGVDAPDTPGSDINPATGLPMVGAMDVAGNPYGVDLSHRHDVDPHGAEWASASRQDDWTGPSSSGWSGDSGGNDW